MARRDTASTDTVRDLPSPPWRRSAGRPARQQLSAASIVDTALRVMDAEGLDSVSMRRIAQELDTGAASLYQHVRNKQELHELMLDRVFAEVTLPEPDARRWREQLKDVLREMYRLMRAHPGIARISLATLIPTTPGLLVAMDTMMGLLRTAGVPDKYVAPACDALALYVTAHAYEASLVPSVAAGEAEAGRRLGEIREYVASLPKDRLPNLAALQPFFGDDDQADHFEFALDVFIAGLATYRRDARRRSR